MGDTSAQLRELAAQLSGTQESAHHGHPDFRVNKKIFATLSAAEDHAALRLTQPEARELSAARPTVFRLVSDRDPIAWVSVHLAEIDPDQFSDLPSEPWQFRA